MVVPNRSNLENSNQSVLYGGSIDNSLCSSLPHLDGLNVASGEVRRKSREGKSSKSPASPSLS